MLFLVKITNLMQSTLSWGQLGKLKTLCNSPVKTISDIFFQLAAEDFHALLGKLNYAPPPPSVRYNECSVCNTFPIGGMMSVFLMGTYNQFTKQWCTVAKCGNGHDDKTLEKINKELQVVKISKVRLSRKLDIFSM